VYISYHRVSRVMTAQCLEKIIDVLLDESRVNGSLRFLGGNYNNVAEDLSTEFSAMGMTDVDGMIQRLGGLMNLCNPGFNDLQDICYAFFYGRTGWFETVVDGDFRYIKILNMPSGEINWYIIHPYEISDGDCNVSVKKRDESVQEIHYYSCLSEVVFRLCDDFIKDDRLRQLVKDHLSIIWAVE